MSIEKLPLSFTQQRIWFLDQLSPNLPLYNIPLAYYLRGDLCINSLKEALTALTNRHEILRTIFKFDGSEPYQVITEENNFFLKEINIETLNADQQEEEIMKFVQEEAEKPFNLSVGPLMRCCLIRLSNNDHVFLLTFHHIIADGWSLGIFYRELNHFYQSIKNKQKSTLSELPIQYADFAIWQRQWLQGDVLRKQLEYWQNHLDDAPELLQLPTDFSRPKVSSFRGAFYHHILPKELVNRLIKFSKSKNITLFMLLFSIYQVLLYRYTSQEDIVTGIPIANRNMPQTEGLIGFFVNTLPLRIKFHNNMNFAMLLDQVREVILNGHDHQDIPFEQLVDSLQVNRDLSRNPIFQTMFMMQSESDTTFSLDKLSVKRIGAKHRYAKFDLTLFINEKNEATSASFDYSLDLFSESTISKMAKHFERLCHNIMDAPDKKILDYTYMTEDEMNDFFNLSKGALVNIPKNKCLQDLFEEQVEKNSDSIALVSNEEELTYAELNEQANQLAHYLRNIGVKSETIVGVCLERSIRLIISLLAILKAGGTYVPLDPSYPIDRLQYMLEDTDAPVLITETQFLENFVDYKGHVLNVDKKWEQLNQFPTTNLNIRCLPQQLAYIIYTSGSTGKPKGVCCDHTSIINRLIWAWDRYPFKENDVCCLQTNIGFVDSLWDILGTLLQGVKLVVFPLQVSKNPEELIHYLKKYVITRIVVVPSFLKILMERYPNLKHELPHLTHWEVTGEIFQKHLIKSFLEKMPGVRLLDVYGATEATSIIYFELSLINNEIHSNCCIISNTDIYLLDQNLQPVPNGIPGEVYAGGIGLANCYYNNPLLTSEKFVPDLFNHDSTKKLYRTGDLARRLANGNIEFLGRADHQIKLRGYRIELGEIEFILSSHPNIKDIVVVDKEDQFGDKYLIAYIVPKDNTLCKNDSLFLQQEINQYSLKYLPDFMRPSAIVVLEKIPTNANGKIDRKKLISPEINQRLISDSYVAPRSILEQKICQLWKELLSIDKVGIFDNFFSLGGHSILATRLLSRINSELHLHFPLRYIFEYPTIASLVEKIINHQPDHSFNKTSITHAGNRKDIPLSYAQQRLWFLDKLFPNSALYNLTEAFYLKGNINIEFLKKSLNLIINRHEILRTTIKEINGIGVQNINENFSFNLEIIDFSSYSENLKDKLLEEHLQSEASTPFNLENGPLIRFKLFRIANEKNIFLTILHHVIADGWSIGIFFRDLSEYYNSLITGNPVALNNLPIQYADFSYWQKNNLTKENLNSQIEFWKKQLSGIPELIQLPLDNSRPKEMSYQGGIYHYVIPDDLLKRIKNFSVEQNTTLFMTLLAIFHVFLYKYTGQTNIVIGSPIANRQHKEVENLIGLFANTLAFCAHCSPHQSFINFLEQVKNNALAAYENQDVPFELLVDQLKIYRNLSYNPIFQVMLALQTMGNANDFDFFGIEKERYNIDSRLAKLDLLIWAHEGKEGLYLSFEYAKELFDNATIMRMATHFHQLIENILNDPKKELGFLSLLSKNERQQILLEWNNTKRDYPKHLGIHQLVEFHAKSNPKKIAITFNDDSINYADLNKKANQLSYYLTQYGVTKETFVAICLDRSIDLVIAILAILKAGGTYIPLDPSYPQDRLEYMIADAKVSILITQALHASRFASLPLKMICIDDKNEISQFIKHPTFNLLNKIDPEQLAYVIYTSGSTGKPKGVKISHASVINYLISFTSIVNFQPDDRFLSITTISFDMSGAEIYSPLIKGAHLIMTSQEVIMDGKSLAQLIQQVSPTFMQATPVTWSILLDSGWKGDSNLNILCGGEALSLSLAKKLIKNGKKLWNLYGPTEATIFSTIKQVQVGELESNINQTNTFAVGTNVPIDLNYPKAMKGTSVSVGQPIANTQIYIVDAQQQPVPVGVAGELYIGGDGLARGYLNRPDLTKEKFVANPFSEDKESKLYRTGDLARYLPDGNIEFLGRIDHQVKLRGYRIELGEIETILQNHTAIKEAVVIIREDTPNKKYIVAYLIKQNDITENELRIYLSSKLPEYMIPHFFISMSHMPLTYNGKIDRKLLPAPDQNQLTQADYIAPRTLIEKQLAKIWSRLLSVSQIGIYDNFFLLGGDSILSIQLVSLARQKNIYFNVKTVFKNPTLIELSQAAKLQNDINGSSPHALSDEEIPLTPIQYWYFEQELEEINYSNQAILLTVNQKLDESHLKNTLFILLEHHPELRHSFYHKDTTGWHQKCLTIENAKNQLIFEVIPLENFTIDETKEFIEKKCSQTQGSLNIEKGPLFQVILFDPKSDEPQRLFLVVHHLIMDNISLKILIEDLETIYSQINSKKKVILPFKTDSYLKWSTALRELAEAESIKSEIPYWKNIISNKQTSIPTDFSKGIHTIGSEKTYRISVEEEVTKTLINYIQKHDIQIVEILLTILIQTIGDWCGYYSHVIGLSSHGRNSIENINVSHTLGWFTSIFPLYIDIANCSTALEALKKVKNLYRSIPNNGIGFGILKYLSKNNELNAMDSSPFIRFNYLGNNAKSTKHMGTLFDVAKERYGSTIGLNNKRSYYLSFNTYIDDGCLKIDITYSENQYNLHTIQKISNLFETKLRNLITYENTSSLNLNTSKFTNEINDKKNKFQHVVAMQPKGNFPPFFCIHPIGGDIHWYWELSKALGINQPFYSLENVSSIESHGHNLTVEQMAERYIKEIKKVQNNGVYDIGGWSFGAVLAYEVAKQLKNSNNIDTRVILIDPPPCNSAGEFKFNSYFDLGFEKYLGKSWLKKSGISIEEFMSLNMAEKRNHISHILKKNNTINIDNWPDIEKLLNVHLSNLTALYNYYLNNHIDMTIIFAEDSVKKYTEYSNFDQTLGWKRFSTCDSTSIIIPGDHYSILKDPHLKNLAANLSIALYKSGVLLV